MSMSVLKTKSLSLFLDIMKTYDNLPSSAIDRIVIDTATNKVEVVYKSSDKTYTYSAEDAASFDQQFLAEFDTEDFSVGRFINSNVSSGTLQLLTT